MGGVINNPPFLTTFHNPSILLVGTIVAIYEVGACVGSIITAIVGEYLGRRRSVLLGLWSCSEERLSQAAVSSSGALMGARIVSGIGMVSLTSLLRSPVLTLMMTYRASSIRPIPYFNQKSRQKRLEVDSSVFQLSCLNAGIMIAYWVRIRKYTGHHDLLYPI